MGLGELHNTDAVTMYRRKFICRDVTEGMMGGGGGLCILCTERARVHCLLMRCTNTWMHGSTILDEFKSLRGGYASMVARPAGTGCSDAEASRKASWTCKGKRKGISIWILIYLRNRNFNVHKIWHRGTRDSSLKFGNEKRLFS